MWFAHQDEVAFEKHRLKGEKGCENVSDHNLRGKLGGAAAPASPCTSYGAGG